MEKEAETAEAMFDVVSIGSATIDAFVETEKNTATMQLEEGRMTPFLTYRSGEKILVKHLVFEVGGGGTNSAACFAKLGLKTGYCGAIGTDLNGATIRQRLANDGITFLGTEVTEQTNFSIVLDSTLIKDRTILAYKGASEHLRLEEVPQWHARWIYVSSLSGESFDTTSAILRAKHEQAKIAINPSSYQIEHHREDVLTWLLLASIVVLNHEEATLLVGECEDQELFTRMHALGPTTVVITNGKNGARISDGTSTYHAEPRPGILVKETTGAGDCFASTFVAAVALGESVEGAVRWAFCNVESHIQQIGAKAGLLSRDELLAAVKGDERPITKF